MTTVLIADDREEDRRLMRLVLERMGHAVIEAANGQLALDQARSSAPNLVLSDILMPEMDGFTLCRRLQEDPRLRHVPFVFVTATYGEQRYQDFAADVGAVRVLLKPFDAQALRAIVDECIQRVGPDDATQRLAQLDEAVFHERHAQAVNWKLEEKVTELEAANARLRAEELRTRSLLSAVVESISKMVEYRDPYTIGHEKRVGHIAMAVGQSMGLEAARVEGLLIAGYLHDVGKIAIPAEILTKPGRLTAVERMLIQTHAEIGFDILSNIDFPWPIAEMVHQHHERMDGSGYPRGLRGEQILLEARILAVADVAEAMTCHRPYRPARGLELALDEIRRGRAIAYDADAADACVRLLEDGRFPMS